MTERQFNQLLDSFQGEPVRNAAQQLINKLVDNMDSMSQRFYVRVLEAFI